MSSSPVRKPHVKASKKPASGKKRPEATPGEQAVAKEHVRDQAERLGSMTTEQRLRELADDQDRLLKTAPSIKAASDDVLKVIQAAGAEFIRRYFPDADSGSFAVHTKAAGMGVWIPIAAPAKSK